MSVDGPGILESDLAHDVHRTLLEAFDAGAAASEILEQVSAFEQDLADDAELELYLVACVRGLWEIGQSNSEYLSRLVRLVESGASWNAWVHAIDEPFAVERGKVVRRLLKSVATPKRSPRKRRAPRTPKDKLFSVGDCLALPVGERTFRGVVAAIYAVQGRWQYYLLVMHPSTESTVESFGAGRYYGHT